ncbi:MAG TPA: hypothetical protein VFY79_06000 [Dehalococcoidia bacterium]|nr:hypothetical protein [Dehalococcoidia bacterium]
MLRVPSLRGATRLAFILALAGGYVTWHTHEALARAHHDDDGDDSGGDDSGDSGDDSGDDSGGDDSGGSGDDSGGGGDDSGGDDSGGDDSGGDDSDDGGAGSDQPAVTAGGLYTIKTYPVRENDRPLTMTQHVTQVRLGIGTDLSAKGAFSSVGVNLEGIYGLKDNFSLIGGVTDAYNFKQFSFYAGFEGGLIYDTLDIRLAANVHRFAYPRFCNDGDAKQPVTCDANSTGLPDGNYTAGGTQFSLDLGFPFRYAVKPQIAIVALQTLISIDFNGSQRGDPNKASMMGLPVYCNGVASGMVADPLNCIENGAKPDLNPSLGFAVNPIPQLSVVVFGQLRIPDFDTSAGNFQIPVTARVEASPTQKLDFGLEFTLLNVKPPAPQSPIDNRFLSLFMQARY